MAVRPRLYFISDFTFSEIRRTASSIRRSLVSAVFALDIHITHRLLYPGVNFWKFSHARLFFLMALRNSGGSGGSFALNFSANGVSPLLSLNRAIPCSVILPSSVSLATLSTFDLDQMLPGL